MLLCTVGTVYLERNSKVEVLSIRTQYGEGEVQVNITEKCYFYITYDVTLQFYSTQVHVYLFWLQFDVSK